MQFSENFSLHHLNTFHIDVKARYFTLLTNMQSLEKLLDTEHYQNSSNHLWLGGGSNILFTSDYEGLVIKNEIKGIQVMDESAENVIVKIGSGENWHEFVLYAIAHQWYGIENLALIPGTIGAAPIQNIGAYGVELKDVFYELEALNLETRKTNVLRSYDCNFGYRTSVFKTSLKNKLFIKSVSLKLSKVPRFNLSYKPLSDYFKDHPTNKITVEEVSEAVIQIRKSKLPDPEIIGNGGSFFKNPVIDQKKGNAFLIQFPQAPHYLNDDGTFKIPAAFLIQECGWKGKTIGNAGVHKDQPLVLVNHGGASGKEVVDLAKRIQDSVYKRFQIKLEPEVNII